MNITDLKTSMEETWMFFLLVFRLGLLLGFAFRVVVS